LIVKKSKVGNFKEFYRSQREQLFGYLMRRTGDYHLSSDILQESFTRYLERYGDEELSTTLLYTIARNAVIDGYRKKLHEALPLKEPGNPHSNPEMHMVVREDYRRVLTAMQQLAPEERDILSLAVSSDLSYREIARVTGTSEGNIKVRVHRARVKLKKMMTEGGK
jgi:RNA polymerase sigma-70 factor (ECF subfamily)